MLLYSIYQFLYNPKETLSLVKTDEELQKILSIKNILLFILSYSVVSLLHIFIWNYDLLPNFRVFIRNVFIYPIGFVIFYIVGLYTIAFFLYELCKIFNRFYQYREILQLTFLSALPFILLMFFYPIPQIGNFILMLGLLYQLFIIYQSGEQFFSFNNNQQFTWFLSLVFCFVIILLILFISMQFYSLLAKFIIKI